MMRETGFVDTLIKIKSNLLNLDANRNSSSKKLIVIEIPRIRQKEWKTIKKRIIARKQRQQ